MVAWGIEPIYAVQLAAALQTHLQSMIQHKQVASEQAGHAHTEQPAAKDMSFASWFAGLKRKEEDEPPTPVHEQ